MSETGLHIYLRSDPSVPYESKAFSILAMSNARSLLQSKNDSIGTLHVYRYRLPVPLLEEDEDQYDLYSRIHELYGGVPSQKQAHELSYAQTSKKPVDIHVLPQKIHVAFTDGKKNWTKSIMANMAVSALKELLLQKKRFAAAGQVSLYRENDDEKKSKELQGDRFLFEYLLPEDDGLRLQVIPTKPAAAISWNAFRKLHPGKSMAQIRTLYWAQPGKQ